MRQEREKPGVILSTVRHGQKLRWYPLCEKDLHKPCLLTCFGCSTESPGELDTIQHGSGESVEN